MDKYLDRLSSKRVSVRMDALSLIIDSFSVSIRRQFAEENFVTLAYQCLCLLKKGSSEEVSLATRAIDLLVITLGPGDNAHEIFEDSLPRLSEALKSGSEPTKIISMLDCLATVTFIGGYIFEEIDRSMQVIWKLIQRVGSNVNGKIHSPAVLAAAISAWSFILTAVDKWRLNYNYCQGPISYFSGLIENDDESVRYAALEALALIFEAGSFKSFSGEAKCSGNSLIHEGRTSTNGYSSIQEMKDNIMQQVRRLPPESIVGKEFKINWLKVFEDGCCPQTSEKIGQNVLQIFAWYQLLQMKFVKRIIGSGFFIHMLANKFLHDLFEFPPETKDLSGPELYECDDNDEVCIEYYIPHLRKNTESSHKRMFNSSNSVHSKARTRLLTKQRMLSQEKNYGYFAVDDGDVL